MDCRILLYIVLSKYLGPRLLDDWVDVLNEQNRRDKPVSPYRSIDLHRIQVWQVLEKQPWSDYY